MKSGNTLSPGDLYLAVRVLRRALVVVAGLFALGLLAVLTSGAASAQTQDNGPTQSPSTGLVGSVVSPLTSGGGVPAVTGAIGTLARPVAPVVHGVSAVLAPVVNPVVTDVAPVLKPVLRPVSRVVAPVLAAASPLVGPMIEPLVHAASPVLAPTTSQLGATAVVSALTGKTTTTGRNLVPSTVAAPPSAVDMSALAVVVAETPTVRSPRPGTIAMAAVFSAHQYGSAVVEAIGGMDPDNQPGAPAAPEAPLAGTSTGSVSSGSGSGGAAGMLIPCGPRAFGGADASETPPVRRPVGPYWCYVFGRNHPS
jgi:hypothetical protein